MKLDSLLISEFVKATKDTPQPKKETTVYGTIVVEDDVRYVKIDGSELLTPVTATADTINGERVTVMIKNHTATVTGNITSPAARVDDVTEVGGLASETSKALGTKVDTEYLNEETARLDERIDLLEDVAGEIQNGMNTMSESIQLLDKNVTNLTPVVLYASDEGSSETVTLEQPVAGYSYLEIYHSDGYVKVASPEGKVINLTTQEFSATDVYFRRTSYTISGNTITPGTASGVQLNLTDSTVTSTEGTNYIKITRVVGLV